MGEIIYIYPPQTGLVFTHSKVLIIQGEMPREEMVE
jgi:hypothetical protein